MAGGKIVVLNPTAEMRVQERPIAARPDSLAGKRLGVLWNGKPNADILLDRVAGLLAERFGVTVTVQTTKPNVSAPAPPDVIQRLIQECDVVVNAIGD